jgi:hypothetical protein
MMQNMTPSINKTKANMQNINIKKENAVDWECLFAAVNVDFSFYRL